jgi:hypothetical protein
LVIQKKVFKKSKFVFILIVHLNWSKQITEALSNGGMKMVEKFVKILAIATVVLMLTSSLALAGNVDGEITSVEGGVYTVKGADGKEYQIKQELAKDLDLKTGDMVEVYIEEAQPVKVKKKEKK